MWFFWWLICNWIWNLKQGGTVLGQPTRVERIGDTFIPFQVFKDYLRGLAESTFRWVIFNFINFIILCKFLSCNSTKMGSLFDLIENPLDLSRHSGRKKKNVFFFYFSFAQNTFIMCASVCMHHMVNTKNAGE